MYLSVFLLESGVSLDLGAMQQGFDAAACTAFVEEFWPARVLPALKDFVRVPNLSKFCDPAHLTNGHMQRAAKALSLSQREQHPIARSWTFGMGT